MKRILAIITTLTISWTAFFISGSEAFASGQLVTTKPAPTINGVKGLLVADLIGGIWDTLQDVPEDFHKLCDSYRQAMVKSSGGNYLGGVSDSLLAQHAYFFDTDSLGEFAGHQLIGYCLSAGASVYVGYENATGQIELVEYDSDSGSGGGFRPSKDINVPSEIFTEAVNNNTASIIPSVQTFDRSWKNNPLSVSSYDSKRTSMFFTFMENGNYFGIDDCRDIYGIPYITYNGVKYYYPYLCHFSYSTKSEVSDDLYPCVDVSLCMKVSDSESTRYYGPRDFTYAIFYNAGAGNSGFALGCSSEYYNTVFTTGSHNPFTFSGSDKFSPFYDEIFFSSVNISESLTSYNFFRGNSGLGIDRPAFTGSVSDKSYNYGFELSTKPFYLGSLSSFLDVSKIPSNSYITISGDSIYDYSITNGDTGDTTNMGDFINNGYTWLNTGSGNQTNTGGNGGGGNVTVGGQIDVGGSVDININVSGGNGGTGTSYNLDTDPVNKYLDDALESSGGVRQFLSTFFDFLPAEIVTLLGVLITTVIICRILKR